MTQRIGSGIRGRKSILFLVHSILYLVTKIEFKQLNSTLTRRQIYLHKWHYSFYSVSYLNQRNFSWTSWQFLYVKRKETWRMKRILLLDFNHSTMLFHQISTDYRVLKQMILDNLSFIKHDTMKMNLMKDITILLVYLRSSFSSTKSSSVTKSKLHV